MLAPPPLRSILACVDLSAGADGVLATAGALALRTGARLHVLHAYGAGGGALGLPRSLGFQGNVYQARRDLLARIRREVPIEAEVGTVEVVFYDTTKSIQQCARAVGADLLVFGPHRARPRADSLLSGTAKRALHATGLPCLIVREPLPLPLERVVVPSDHSASARLALEVGLAWAAALGPRAGSRGAAEVRVAHVASATFRTVWDLVRDDPNDLARREAREARVAATVAEHAGPVLEDHLTGDDPVDEIIKYAEQHATQLLVMSARERSTVRRMLLGCAAAAVSRRAPCAVLLVPPQRAEPAVRAAGEIGVVASIA